MKPLTASQDLICELQNHNLYSRSKPSKSRDRKSQTEAAEKLIDFGKNSKHRLQFAHKIQSEHLDNE